jgi:hypothetical protein
MEGAISHETFEIDLLSQDVPAGGTTIEESAQLFQFYYF